jgi:hypothetical protein
VYVESVDTNGNASAANILYYQNWSPLFFDGRVQLKQNLIFLLRAGLSSLPFQFTELYTNYGENDYSLIIEPVNYAYAGCYSSSAYNNGNGGVAYDYFLNNFQPFEDNYLYRNFVFNLSDVNSYGVLSSFENVFSLDQSGPEGLNEPPAYQFQPPATNGASITAILSTNDTRWLLSFGFAERRRCHRLKATLSL